MVWVVWLRLWREKNQARPIRLKNFRIGQSLSNWIESDGRFESQSFAGPYIKHLIVNNNSEESHAVYLLDSVLCGLPPCFVQQHGADKTRRDCASACGNEQRQGCWSTWQQHYTEGHAWQHWTWGSACDLPSNLAFSRLSHSCLDCTQTDSWGTPSAEPSSNSTNTI